MSARDLYTGESWSVARDVERLGAALWVVSAGYGLVAADTQLGAYGATFSLGKADSVGSTGVECREWWRHLCGWQGPTDQRSTLGELCQEGTLVVAAAAPYLLPMLDEIERLPPERVLVVSAGLPKGVLSEHRLPAEGRFRTAVGGSMMSLNVRVAKCLLEMGGADIGRNEAVRVMSDLGRKSSPLPTHNRTRISDHDLRALIARVRSADPTIRWTALHRQLREDGIACEQSRFRSMYGEVVV